MPLYICVNVSFCSHVLLFALFCYSIFHVTVDKVKSSSGSKRDKSSRSTIWESPTGTFAEPLKPIKVGASAELSAPAGSSLNESDDRNSAQGKRSERSESAYSSISFAKESATMRPKSTPPDVWSSRGRAHTGAMRSCLMMMIDCYQNISFMNCVFVNFNNDEMFWPRNRHFHAFVFLFSLHAEHVFFCPLFTSCPLSQAVYFSKQTAQKSSFQKST